MTKRRVTALLVSVVLISVWLTHRAFLWDVFLEDGEMQACSKPLFGRSLVYCLPNAKADRTLCGRDGCERRLWCDCAWAPKPHVWYSEEP